MQPLISPVDHEGRNNCSHGDEDERPSEATPLLTGRQVATSILESRNPFTVLTVTLLVFMFITGVAIGVYLLVQQENIFPPVEGSLHVSRYQWEDGNLLAIEQRPRITLPAAYALIVPTETETCASTVQCERLLKGMQKNWSSNGGDIFLPYNFLVSSNGETFYELGWEWQSPLFPEYSNTSLVIAFIGNFTDHSPGDLQTKELKRFLNASVSKGQLSKSFSVIGKSIKNHPVYLFKSLSELPQWDTQLSDV